MEEVPSTSRDSDAHDPHTGKGKSATRKSPRVLCWHSTRGNHQLRSACLARNYSLDIYGSDRPFLAPALLIILPETRKRPSKYHFCKLSTTTTASFWQLFFFILDDLILPYFDVQLSKCCLSDDESELLKLCSWPAACSRES